MSERYAPSVRQLDCSFPGCDRVEYRAGLCYGHMKQRYRVGLSGLKPLRRPPSVVEDLTGRPDGCPRCDLNSGGGLCLVCRMELGEAEDTA